jgi:RNA polymerase sigma-B factor
MKRITVFHQVDPTAGSQRMPRQDGDEAVMAAFARLRARPDRAQRNRLVEEYRWMAEACARRLSRRGEPLDDLVQVALLGLVKAVDRFDPAFGIPFRVYATTTMRGELRRHYRDHTWALKVPRRMKDLSVGTSAVVDRLTQRLGRTPTVADLAVELGVGEDDVVEMLTASAGYRTCSLDGATGREDGTAPVEPGVEDLELSAAELRPDVARMLAILPARQRAVLYLRFFRQMTQQEIGDHLGLSQVHISRLLRAALDALRAADADVPQRLAA